MRVKPSENPDVAAVMATDPILAWRAGCSLWMSALSIVLLVWSVLISVAQGSTESGGELAACLGAYGFFWFAGLTYGAGEAVEGSVEPAEAYRSALALRAGMMVLGYSLFFWSDDSGLWMAAAVTMAGLWTGAFVESACVGCVARENGFSIRKASIVCMCVAAAGSPTSVRKKTQSDG
ncbi:MAG: hypothetical protein OYH76_19135 [Defluviicoccus sp.]|nr:hypothetical protein [Defluviicoccus sp.]MDE0278015.1 hypothetical protein [Defluviicoccus sp.]